MLGGGIFVTANKTLPGTYINFISAANASAELSDRGVVALPIELDWGVDGDVYTVTATEFIKDALKIFGYAYDHEKLKGLRDLFKNAQKCYFYKLMNSGVAANNTYGTAKYKGIRGNDLKIVIDVNVDDITKMDVSTYMDTTLVDKQTVLPNSDNLVDNDFVVWGSNITLVTTAGTVFTGGSNGDAVTSADHQAAINALESYQPNIIGCLSESPEIISLYIVWTKRLRDDLGVKLQVVVYRTESVDHEGVISIENTVTDTGALAYSLIPWVAGATAGCEINKSLTNRIYDGEYTPNVSYTQAALETAIKSGKFMFHKVGDSIRILEDINTFITVTDTKSSDFSSNQTIRILDQIANDIAVLFNTRYLGQVPNDEAGRISLWNDIVKHHQEMQKIRAIENFNPEDVQITAGSTKKSVMVNDIVTPVNCMEKLYMVVQVN